MIGIKHKRTSRLWLLVCLSIWALVSCQSSTIVIEDQSHSLATIKKAIIAVFPGGLRQRSSNGRELSSAYFTSLGYEPIEDAAKANERSYMKVIVLGDRRPYNLEVVVMKERKSKGQFSEIEVDEKATHKFAQDLRNKLAQSRDDSSVVDEFRAF